MLGKGLSFGKVHWFMAYGLGHQGFTPFMGISTIPLNPFYPKPYAPGVAFPGFGACCRSRDLGRTPSQQARTLARFLELEGRCRNPKLVFECSRMVPGLEYGSSAEGPVGLAVQNTFEDLLNTKHLAQLPRSSNVALLAGSSVCIFPRDWYLPP